MNSEKQVEAKSLGSNPLYYSKQGLWSLFLMCALPLHLWTIILAFRDLSWLIDRSGLWDAISVMCYGLIFAFVESILIFLIAVLLGFLVSKHWGQERRVALMSILVLITALWAIITQLYSLLQISPPESLIRLLANIPHPVRYMYIAAFILILLVTFVLTYFILRSDGFLRSIRELIDRFSLLMNFYLFLDVVGLIIVIFRNIHGR